MGYLIQGVYVPGGKTPADVRIREDRIVEIAPGLAPGEDTVIEGNGSFLSPGFVDLHMHLEKALTIGDTESPGLIDAIVNFREYCENRISPQDIRERSIRVLERASRNGTTAVRTHVSVDECLKTMAVEAMLEVREEVRDWMDLEIIVMLSRMDLDDEVYAIMDSLGSTDIRGFGSAPALSDDPVRQIDRIFQLALRHGKIVDLHADEHDEPRVDTIDAFADRIVAEGMEGLCTAGHLCALSAVDEDKARETIGKIRRADMNVVTLPSCNLYLMGRGDRGLIRRGTTRIRELLDAGVNVSLASDNIRDPFRPFGNGNILEEMLLTAQVAQMGTFTDLERVFDMGTVNPARAMGRTDHGIREGARADLVLLDAPGAAEAILDQAPRRLVMKNGRILWENRSETLRHF